jgi:hypothetical protein
VIRQAYNASRLANAEPVDVQSDLDLSADAEALAHKLAPAAAPELYTRREKRRPPTLMSIAFPAPSRLIVQELADPARYPKTARAQSHLH